MQDGETPSHKRDAHSISAAAESEAKRARQETGGVSNSQQCPPQEQAPPVPADNRDQGKEGKDNDSTAAASGAQPSAGAATGTGANDPPTTGVALDVEAAAAKLVTVLPPSALAKTRLVAAVSEDKGCRPSMEDVHVISIDADQGTGPGQATAGSTPVRVSFFGIWDGHGGSTCARFASEHLHSHALQAGLLAKACPGTNGKPDVKGVKQAVTEAFRTTDAALLQQCTSQGWQDGACAVCCWVVRELCLVANVGDAKAVLARVSDKEGSKGQLKALTLTREHLALHAAERSRIEKAGGFVSADGRLNARMQVSRSFGDAALKKAGCSALPDVQAFEITERDQFLVLGCDGFWGVWDGQGCVDTVSSLLAEGGRDEKGITNRLLNISVRERGAKDNCTVMLIRFMAQL